MWVLKKKFDFEASHILTGHDGKCARLHGHSWKGEIEVEGVQLILTGPQKNMLMDYAILSKIMDPIVESLDHQHLNVVLNEQNPTSELVAYWIYEQVAKCFPQDGVILKAITIEETCTSSCRYAP